MAAQNDQAPRPQSPDMGAMMSTFGAPIKKAAL
jgi:hypothetical protein